MKPQKLILEPYQQSMLQFMRHLRRCNIWAEMGLGKTVVALSKLRDLFVVDGLKKALVLAPLEATMSTWPNELDKWQQFSHLRYSIIAGKPFERLSALEKQADIYLCSYSNAPWLFKLFSRNWKSWPFTAVVADEANAFKNPRSVRFKRAKKILPYTKWWFNLTGIPGPNGLQDLWSQMYLIDGGRRLGTEYYKSFLCTYYNPHRFSRYKWELKPFMDEVIFEKVADVSASLSAEDYAELPDLIIHPVEVALTPTQRQEYKKLERDFYLKVGPDIINCGHAAAKSIKCRQFTNGAVYINDPVTGAATNRWVKIHDHKIQALKRIVSETAGNPLLVAYEFKSDVERIKQVFPHAVTVSEVKGNVEQEWNAGRIPMLLIHGPNATSLNLQSGRYGVWFGPTWDLNGWKQFRKRLHRKGQTKNVFIWVIICKDTIEDNEMLPRLDVKSDLHKNLMSATELIV